MPAERSAFLTIGFTYLFQAVRRPTKSPTNADARVKDAVTARAPSVSHDARVRVFMTGAARAEGSRYPVRP